MRTALLLGVSLCVSVVATAEATTGPLPFIEDDYPTALREATRNKVPIFVDAWAPW